MALLQYFLYSLLVALLCFFYWLRKQLSYWQSRGIACDSPNWLMGNFSGVTVKRSYSDIWWETYKKFKGTGPFCGFYWHQKPAAFILDQQLAKNILVRDFSQFADRGFYTNEKDDPLSGQIFMLNGHKWRDMRNKLTPVFSIQKIKNMFATVFDLGEQLVSALNEALRDSAVVDVKDFASRFTIDVIGTCAFGIDCSSFKDPTTEFHTMGKTICVEHRYGSLLATFFLTFPKFGRYLHIKVFPDNLIEFILRIVRVNAEYRKQLNIKRNDFFDLLLELRKNKSMISEDSKNYKNLSIEEVAAQAMFFLFVGFEATSNAISFALYELAQHDDIQERAREEVVRVLDKNNQQLTYECLNELQYLDQIISETMRLHSLFPVLNRVCLSDYKVEGHPKYFIEKDTMVLIPICVYHRDPDVYPNPDEFNPEHFTPEKVKLRDSVSWMPYSIGPRSCIGMRFGQMQLQIALALLLKHFKFTVCEETTVPVAYDRKKFWMSPDKSVYLKFERLSG